MFDENKQRGLPPYGLDRNSDMLTACLVAEGSLPFFGPGSVMDILESQREVKNGRTVIPKQRCHDGFQVEEVYVILDRNGKQEGECSRATLLRSARAGDAECFVNDYAKLVKAGRFYRAYKITDGRTEWKDEAKLLDFVFALDAIRRIKGEDSFQIRGTSKLCFMPFVPVYGLEIYTEVKIKEYLEGVEQRKNRRKFAQIYRSQTGKTAAQEEIWEDKSWDENGYYLERGKDGQIKAVLTTEKEVHYDDKKSILNYGNNWLVKPNKEFPNLEEATVNRVLNDLKDCKTVFDQVRLMRVYFEQFCLVARVAFKSLKSAKDLEEPYRNFVLFNQMVKLIPPEIMDYIIIEAKLTPEQEDILYDVENISDERLEKIIGSGTVKLQEEAAEVLRQLIDRTFAKIERAVDDSKQSPITLEDVKNKLLNAIDGLDWQVFNELKRKKRKLKQGESSDSEQENGSRRGNKAKNKDSENDNQAKNDKKSGTKGENQSPEAPSSNGEGVLAQALLETAQAINRLTSQQGADQGQENGQNQGQRQGQGKGQPAKPKQGKNQHGKGQQSKGAQSKNQKQNPQGKKK